MWLLSSLNVRVTAFPFRASRSQSRTSGRSEALTPSRSSLRRQWPSAPSAKSDRDDLKSMMIASIYGSCPNTITHRHSVIRQLACKHVQLILPIAKQFLRPSNQACEINIATVKQSSRPCILPVATSLRPRRQRDPRSHNERLLVSRPQDHRRRHGGQVQQQVEGLPRKPCLHAHRLEMN